MGWEFDGGRVEANTADNRLQIFFDEKPDKEIREELKGNGFRYAPSTEAWQRQLNDNAIYAADCIKCIQPLTGERPTELQKRASQEAAAEKAAAPEQPQDTEPGTADAPEKPTTPETFYKVRQNSYSDSPENSYILQEYVAQDNGMAKLGDILYTGAPEKCRELLGKLETGELTQGDVKDLYAKAQEAQTAAEPGQDVPEQTADKKEPDKDTFSIYQLKDGDGMRDYHFEPYDRLQAAGLSVEAANYNLIYAAELTPGTSLEDIYTRFNIDHPKDFKGHSLSVSDVVVLHQNGQDTAHYVDSLGYKDVPEFLQPKNYLKAAEQTTEQNYNMIDGQINNTPSVDELEEKAKRGEVISLSALAAAVKAEDGRTPQRDPDGKKPSIRAQLKADRAQSCKPQQREKEQEAKRSIRQALEME